MKTLICIILIFLSLSSCSLELWRTVEVRIVEHHQFEEASGKLMWYELRYFNGREIVNARLAPGTSRFSIRVLAGRTCPIAVVPLGILSPYGGFYSPGDDTVFISSLEGPFASLLVNAASYRPDAVSELSIPWLRKIGDFSTINQSEFLNSLYRGSLSYDSLEYSKLYHPIIESIPSGYWISDSSRANSFQIRKSGDSARLSLFTGSYCFWNKERELLLTVVIDEEGRFYTGMTSLSSSWI